MNRHLVSAVPTAFAVAVVLAGCTSSPAPSSTTAPGSGTSAPQATTTDEATPSSTAIPTGPGTSIAPTAAVLKLGQAGTADGLTFTVLSVRLHPHSPLSQRRVESYAVQVKACAASTTAVIWNDRWYLVSADGHAYMQDMGFFNAPTSDTSSETPDPSPFFGFPQPTLSPGTCQTGSFSVNVPDGTKAAYVTYEAPGGPHLLWRVA